jgi:hypothetical protein
MQSSEHERCTISQKIKYVLFLYNVIIVMLYPYNNISPLRPLNSFCVNKDCLHAYNILATRMQQHAYLFLLRYVYLHFSSEDLIWISYFIIADTSSLGLYYPVMQEGNQLFYLIFCRLDRSSDVECSWSGTIMVSLVNPFRVALCF